MKYEILLTDTARIELAQHSDDAIHNLLDRISRSAEADHILSAPVSAFELRYQSLDSLYVFFRRAETPPQATVMYFCEMQVPQLAVPPTGRVNKLLNWQTREIPDGMEIEMATELTRHGGAPTTLRQFARKTDLGDSYTLFHHLVMGDKPPVVMIVTGRKGAVDGDYRNDEVEIVTLAPDGTVQRFPPTPTRVLLTRPLDGLSPEQQFARMGELINTEEFRQRMDNIRTRFAE